ncbi:MAG: cytochrome P450 [Deltaproteobacteria bacterium]|nr:cytochrome P450 [Deltaproteobacteria bacterium]MBW2361217.1 cytochrome P450 [Deltaproteobacteria bacterium]
MPNDHVASSGAPAPESLSDPAEVLDIILDPRRRGTLYPYYHRLRELDPVHGTEVLHGCPGWVLTADADARAVLGNHDMFSDAHNVQIFDTGPGGNLFFEMMKRTLLYVDPPDHDRLRRFLGKRFTPRAVEQWRPRLQKIADELLDRAEDAGKLEVVSEFAYPYPTTLICEWLGVPKDDLPIIHDWLNDFARRGDISGVTPEVERRGEEATRGFTDYFLGHIKDRRKRPGEDLVTVLVQLEDDRGKLTDDELVAACILLIQGGHETTANMLCLNTLSLLNNPDQLQILRDEPARISAAVDELIRYDSSVHVVQRVGTEDIQLRGKTISAGEVCLILTGATNRDPACYPDPDRLDLDRPDVHHLTFGLGRHVCLGGRLARMELEVALGSLLARFPKLQIAGDSQPELRDGLFLRGLKSLPVTW